MTLESVQVRSFGASGAAPTSIRSLRSWTKEDGDATCASASTRRPRSSFITRFRNRTENLTPGLSAPTLQSNLSVGPGIRSELEGGFLQTVCRERRPFWNREQLRGYPIDAKSYQFDVHFWNKKVAQFLFDYVIINKVNDIHLCQWYSTWAKSPPPQGGDFCKIEYTKFLNWFHK